MRSSPLVTKSSLGYRLALLGVAATMVLLPVCYFGLFAALLYGLYWYATRWFLEIFQSLHGSLLVSIVGAGAPLLIGWVAALSLARPLFAGRGTRLPPVELAPEEAPGIYRLTAEVCQMLGAKPPGRIEVSCIPNASAGLETGWRGFFGGKTVLTLGLPLAAELTQRELAGVIAHELGHFRQRAGMRATFLIRSVNHWFGRVLSTRPAWDPALQAGSGGGSSVWVLAIMAYTHMGNVFGRQVLWLLMMAGHAVGATLMRQMEYDADRCEVRVAGSAAFETVSVKLSSLGKRFGSLLEQMQLGWYTRRRLPEDMPGLLHALTTRETSGSVRISHLSAEEPKAAWFDTHPTMTARRAQARALNLTGEEFSDDPARELFDDFDAVSRRVTRAYYEDGLNLPISKRVLLSSEEWLRQASPQPPPLPVAEVKS